MKIDPQDQKEFLKFIKIFLMISVLTQVIILLAYLFKEQQTALAFPMVLSLFVTGVALAYAFLLRD
ncbi:TPA: hypothetical protein ACGO1T_000179 [Streptococcus suis]